MQSTVINKYDFILTYQNPMTQQEDEGTISVFNSGGNQELERTI